MSDTADLRVHETNAEQLRAWDGAEGDYWTRHADQYDAAVVGFHHRLLESAGIRAGDAVLDIGCGKGQLMRDAARLARTGSALGIDLSGRMIEEARRRAEAAGVRNARCEQADAQVHPFPDAAYDLVLSRTGTMFFGAPMAAFTNIARAVRPGGRLVIAVWQPLSENEWFSAFGTALAAGRDLPAPPPGAPGPFAMSDPAAVQRMLTGSGFAEVLGQMAWLIADLAEDARPAARQALLRTMEEHEADDGVRFGSAMWLIRARRPGVR